MQSQLQPRHLHVRALAAQQVPCQASQWQGVGCRQGWELWALAASLSRRQLHQVHLAQATLCTSQGGGAVTAHGTGQVGGSFHLDAYAPMPSVSCEGPPFHFAGTVRHGCPCCGTPAASTPVAAWQVKAGPNPCRRPQHPLYNMHSHMSQTCAGRYTWIVRCRSALGSARFARVSPWPGPSTLCGSRRPKPAAT